MRPSDKRACVGKYAHVEASRYGVAKEPEAVDFTPSRKAASEVKGARTANRHR